MINKPIHSKMKPLLHWFFNKTKMKKNIEWWGVEMNIIEDFKFSQFINQPTTQRPNTLTKEQRITLVSEFLNTIRNGNENHI